MHGQCVGHSYNHLQNSDWLPYKKVSPREQVALMRMCHDPIFSLRNIEKGGSANRNSINPLAATEWKSEVVGGGWAEPSSYLEAWPLCSSNVSGRY